MRKIFNIKVLFIVSIALLLVYLLSCLILSIFVSKSIKAVYQSECYKNLKSPIYVTESGYDGLNFKKHYGDENKKHTVGKFSHSFPMVIITPMQCKAYFSYSYTERDKTGNLFSGGSSDAEAIIKFYNKKLAIVKCTEKP